MPIFAQGVTRDKLTILHYAKASQLDLTREQLYRAMVENDCMSYFDFETVMQELEEDGFIAAIPRVFGQGYRITFRGEESLRLFDESLPNSLRQRLNGYADAHREAFRRENQLVSSMRAEPDGSYVVDLRAQEKKGVILEISMRVAGREMAKRMRANWESAAEGVYEFLLANLLRSDAAAQPDDPGEPADE